MLDEPGDLTAPDQEHWKDALVAKITPSSSKGVVSWRLFYPVRSYKLG